MHKEKITLKDIAEAAGVSTTTVHRSLYGKSGVGEAMDKKIKKLASEMGYCQNYFAANLKRNRMRIAVALPEPILDNKFYYLGLWLGVRKLMEEIPEFGVELMEFYYPIAEGSNGAILKEIYDNHVDDINGLLTIAIEHNQSSYFLEKFKDKGIPVVLLGSDLHKSSRLCCVKTYDEMAGSLGAELLTLFNDNNNNREIIVTGSPTGPFGMVDQFYNLNGFQEYIRSHNRNVTIINAFGASEMSVYDMIKKILLQQPQIFAIYASSARHTVQMCQVVEDLNLQGKIKLVGNDCFSESIHYLKKGTLTAIIDKKISTQSYLAMQALTNFVIKGKYPVNSLLYVSPTVVLQSNIDTDMNTKQSK